MTTRAPKPLGRKAYGSIGHLPDSRIGPGDHHVHEGQARICTEKARDRHDRIIVTEKMDGSCTAVANIDGAVFALGRAGWLAESSPYEQHQMFAEWVQTNLSRFDTLKPGERLVGEWMAQAHGTRYAGLNEPWYVFDLFQGQARITASELCFSYDDRFSMPTVLSVGPAFSVAAALKTLGNAGHWDALDSVEGAVWRVERRGAFDFLAKYVRPEKQDGMYLPELSGNPAVWNWRPT